MRTRSDHYRLAQKILRFAKYYFPSSIFGQNSEEYLDLVTMDRQNMNYELSPLDGGLLLYICFSVLHIYLSKILIKNDVVVHISGSNYVTG